MSKNNLHLNDMIRGWFVGNFTPTAFKTTACEVAVKTFQKGEYEERHYHKIATEITVVISGEVEMNSGHYCSGDIIVMNPFESTDFLALTEAVVVAVKIPGATDDKYISEK